MEFIQVIVVIAIMGYAVYNNMQKEKARARKRKSAQPRPAPVEATAADDGADDHTPPPPRGMTTDTTRPRRNPQPSPVRPAVATPRRPSTAAPTAGPTGSGRDISLRTADEARRAFICSEIFKRKY